MELARNTFIILQSDNAQILIYFPKYFLSITATAAAAAAAAAAAVAAAAAAFLVHSPKSYIILQAVAIVER